MSAMGREPTDPASRMIRMRASVRGCSVMAKLWPVQRELLPAEAYMVGPASVTSRDGDDDDQIRDADQVVVAGDDYRRAGSCLLVTAGGVEVDPDGVTPEQPLRHPRFARPRPRRDPHLRGYPSPW